MAKVGELPEFEKLTLESLEPVADPSLEVLDLLKVISGLFSSIYQIEETRHASSSSPQNGPTTSIDELVTILDTSISDIRPRVSHLTAEGGIVDAENIDEQDKTELKEEWEKLLRTRALLGEELREDGWLTRFRTTAEQAEAMMDPLQKSLADCTAFLDAHKKGSILESSSSALDDLLKSHESMKATYVPSVTKILKMVKKSVQDRSTQNGEALRRLGEMQSRWAILSRQLQQLDTRFKGVRDQAQVGTGLMEVSDDNVSQRKIQKDDYFGAATARPAPHQAPNGREPNILSRRSSFRAGSKSPVGETTRTIKRQPSNISQSAAGDKPRWDIGTRPPPVPTVPSMYQTPSSRRLSTFGPRPPVPVARSPTPSSSSITSGSRISVPGSRIPVRSPPPTTRSELVVPSFSALASSEAMNVDTSRRQTLGPDSYLTPTRPRQSAPFSLPRSTTPALAPRSVSYGATLNPGFRSEPRRTLGRNPPSSFRSNTPTPSRPSSRLSATSMMVSAAAMTPFEPSKYDLLDQEVSKLIAQVGFDLFVARLDPPLKRGQRKREDEEWKGEFVFGAGERTSSVKLLKLVGRAMDGGQVRMKCMCRVAGAWQELSAVLRDRLARVSQDQQLSP